jgi:hypothetical protein
MATQAEKKTLNYTIAAGSYIGIYGSGSFVTNGFLALSPFPGFLSCVAGTNANQRVGNSITIRSAKLRLMFTPYTYSALYNPTPGPLLVSVILYYERANPLTFDTNLTNLYQNGSVSDNPSVTGLSYDTMKPFNNDRYKVFRRKTLKIGSAVQVTGADGNYGNSANNDFKSNGKLTIDYTKYLIKKVKYDDATAAPSGQRGLFCAILIHSGDGRALNVGYRYVNVNGTLEMKYTDI